MKILFHLLSNYKKELVLGPILKLIEAIIEISLPFIIANTIDTISMLTFHQMLFRGVLLFFLILIGVLCASLAQFYAAKASQGFGTDMRNNLFSHILQLSNRQVEEIGSSALVNRITNDVTNLEIAVAMFIRLVIRVPFICIGSLIMVWILNANLAIILLLATIVLSLLSFFLIRFASSLHQKANKSLDRLLLRAKENLVNIRLVRSFVTQKKETEKFSRINTETFRLTKKANILSGLFNPFTVLILDIAILAVLYLGNIEIGIGNLTQGNLIAIISYIFQMLLAVIVLSNLITIYTKSYSSSKRILDVFLQEPEIKNGTQTSKANTSDCITFHHVDFGYHPSSCVLEQLSLQVKQGECIGIVGSTGSGKSTFLNLINRSYDISSGELLLFGKPIQEYDTSFLKKKIRFIAQRPSFLTSSIYDNVVLGQQASKKAVISALEKAQALDFVSLLPNTLDYILENNASNLSGGQRQRISIARSFIGTPAILLLDDITSSLDVATEAQVLQNIFTFSKENKITTFIASQKTTTVSHCDRILVLQDGKIVAIGTHEELLDHCHFYQNLNAIYQKGGK